MSTGPRSSDSQSGSADDTLVLVEDAAPLPEERARPCWKVAVIDDDQAVHDGTRSRSTIMCSMAKASSCSRPTRPTQARALLREHPDIAVILLDVVMETETAGLDLVEYIRRTLKNDPVRIILRTGQPGQAPERDVIVDYDINDYKAKTELTAAKLFTALTAALAQLSAAAPHDRHPPRARDHHRRHGHPRRSALASPPGGGHSDPARIAARRRCAGILVLREGSDLDTRLLGAGRIGLLPTMVGEGAGARVSRPALLAVIEDAFQRRRTEFAAERTVLYIGTG